MTGRAPRAVILCCPGRIGLAANTHHAISKTLPSPDPLGSHIAEYDGDRVVHNGLQQTLIPNKIL